MRSQDQHPGRHPTLGTAWGLERLFLGACPHSLMLSHSWGKETANLTTLSGLGPPRARQADQGPPHRNHR